MDEKKSRVLKPHEYFELRVFNHGTHCEVVSPQAPGASAAGQSDSAAIGNFVKQNAAELGVVITNE